VMTQPLIPSLNFAGCVTTTSEVFSFLYDTASIIKDAFQKYPNS
jgi:hypothetical protein